MKRIAFVVLALFPLSAMAQYNGPAIEACRAYAKKELQREGATASDIVFERDSSLLAERYARKLGNQTVAFILTGNGAVVLKDAPSVELSFICLLADEKKPVFFNWLPRQNVSAMAQCRRSEALRARSRSCLELLLRTAEMDLTGVYAQRFQEANASGEKALAAYRKSNDEWRQYRDAECERRQPLAPAGVKPEDFHLACVVELTRRRGLDLR
jgi:uncharacterized protein YecT (DUF1311 family)